MLRRLLHLLTDSLAYGVSGLLGQLIGFLLLPIYTRRLEPSDYGVLAMLSILPNVFPILAAAGVKSAVFQQFYKRDSDDRRRIVLSTAAASVLLSAALILFVSLLCARWIARLLIDDEATYFVSLSLISAAVTTLNDIPLTALQAHRKAKTVGLLNICQLLATVSLTIYMVVVLRMGVRGVVLSTLIGACFSLALCFATAARFFTWGVDWHIWKAMAAYSLPFLPHRLQSVLFVFLGDYMIRMQLGLAEVGLYSVASRFAVPLIFVSAAIQRAWTPYKFKVYAEDSDARPFFRSTFTYYICLISYLWMGIAIWGPEAVRVMTDAAFHEAAALVWAVALMRSAQAVCPMIGTGLELSDNTRALPLVSFASLVTVIIAGVTLMPLFGVYGAIFATTLAWLVIDGGYFILSQRQIRIDYDWRSVASLFIVAAIMVLLGQLVQPYAMWLRLTVIVTMTISFPILAMLILARSPSERHRVEILASRVLGRQWRKRGGIEEQPM